MSPFYLNTNCGSTQPKYEYIYWNWDKDFTYKKPEFLLLLKKIHNLKNSGQVSRISLSINNIQKKEMYAMTRLYFLFTKES